VEWAPQKGRGSPLSSLYPASCSSPSSPLPPPPSPPPPDAQLRSLVLAAVPRRGNTPRWGVPRALRRRARRRVHWNSVPSERCNALSSLPDSASRPRASARRPPRRRAERTRGSVMTDSGDAITGWERGRGGATSQGQIRRSRMLGGSAGTRSYVGI